MKWNDLTRRGQYTALFLGLLIFLTLLALAGMAAPTLPNQ